MGKVYKNLGKSESPILDKLLHDKCISRGEVMKETGVSRNHYYLSGCKDNFFKGFIRIHENDWTFTPEKLFDAIVKSGDTQKAVADKLGIHFVTLNVFLKGRQRPTRLKAGHYQKIESFCKEWFCF
jgi:DNA-binding Xre family transcriptional regulator